MTAEQQVRGIDQQITEVILKNDAAALERLLDDQYVGTSPDGGDLTKASWLADIRAGRSRYDRYDVDRVQIQIHGDTAVVKMQVTRQGVFAGRPIDDRVIQTRVHRQRDGQWRLIAWHATRLLAP